MADQMIPRISIRDNDDREIVTAALVQYLARIATSAMMTGDVCGLVEDSSRVVALIDSIVVDANVPNDDEIRDHVEKMAREFGPGDTAV